MIAPPSLSPPLHPLLSTPARSFSLPSQVVQKLLDNLTSQLAQESAHHLELIVIWLIVAEVVLDIFRDGILPTLFKSLLNGHGPSDG